MGKKYIVTGGAGFIGSHLVAELVRLGHEVIVVDDLSTGFLDYLPKGAKLLKVDISNWLQLTKNFAYFQGIDGVFHLAACARIQPSIFEPARTHEVNVNGTLNILEMMRMMGIKKIVYSASSSSYGLKATLPCREDMQPDCLNPYAATKYIGEIYCKTWGNLYGIKNACLKYFNVYGRRSPLEGPYAPVIGLFFRQAVKLQKPMTIVGDGEQKRDFTHVGDVVAANIAAMRELGENSEEVSGLTYNIGTGKNYTVNEVARLVQAALVNVCQAPTVNIPARPGEAQATLADITLARTLLKWEPTVTLEQGIDDLKNYYIEYFKNEAD